MRKIFRYFLISLIWLANSDAMANEISLEVYTVRIRKIGNKSTFYSLSNFQDGLDLFRVFQEFRSGLLVRKIDKELKKSIEFTRSFKLDKENRVISGILESGNYGIQEKIVDTGFDENEQEKPAEGKKTRTNKEKKFTDLGIKPFYFCVFIPENTNVGLLILQRIGIYGIHGIFSQSLNNYMEKYSPFVIDLSPYASKELGKRLLNEGGIKEISMRRYNLPSDKADHLNIATYLEDVQSIELRIIAKNNHYLPINDRAKKFINNPNIAMIDFPGAALIGMDGKQKTRLKVKIGNHTRVVDLSENLQIRPYFDIDEDVKRHRTTKHPQFNSIDELAKGLLEDIKTENMKL